MADEHCSRSDHGTYSSTPVTFGTFEFYVQKLHSEAEPLGPLALITTASRSFSQSDHLLALADMPHLGHQQC